MSRDDVSSQDCNRTFGTRISKKQHDTPASYWKSTATRHAPAFWDSLDSIFITRAALREFCRRNALRPKAKGSVKKTRVPPVFSSNLQSFARNGGPGLSDLRGYSDSDRKDTSDEAPDAESKSNLRKILAYDLNFMTRLEAENIHPPRCDHLPVNFKTLQNCLKESRNSLSPTDIFDGEFRSFMKEMLIAQHEVHVLENVLSIILGAHHYSSIKNHLCDNWIPIIDNDVVIPRPGFFDGVQLELEDFWIQEGFLSREDLYKFIFPSSGDYTCPFLPNFFGEAKGSGDSMTIGRRQVCYHGAYGARGMHRLQNYMSQEIYDEVARTFSFVYSKGFLYMYAHHMSQPDGPNTLPHYHMNHLGSWALSNSWQTTVEALTAVRNVRDLACDLREQVLDDAKQRQGKPTRPHAKNDATNSLMWIVPAAAGVALVYFAGVESLWSSTAE